MKHKGYPETFGSPHHRENQQDKTYGGIALEKRNALSFFQNDHRVDDPQKSPGREFQRVED